MAYRFKAALWCHSLAVVLLALSQLIGCESRTAYCSRELQRLQAENGGEIASHTNAGTANYNHSLQCYWQIDAPSGKRVIVWFTYMDLQVPSDKVTLYDGLTTSSTIAVVSLNDTQAYTSPKFASTSNILTVNFYSDGSVARKGFRLNYNVTSSANSSACGPLTFDDASNSSGRIVSHPEYGHLALYAKSVSCSWTLPSISGKFYYLTVGNVSMGSGDCLAINRGSTGGSSNLNLCGWIATAHVPLEMDGNVQIIFTSNGVHESTGFELLFRTANSCPDNRNLTNTTGEIISHSSVGVLSYWNRMNCVWYITAPRHEQVWFWFTYFDMTHPYDRDYISVRDVGESTSSSIAHISMYSSPQDGYQSKTNVISVSFVTDSYYSSLGFRLQFNFTKLYCQGIENVTATKFEAEIKSHVRAGSLHYLNSMDCYWRISAPVGQRIVFRFPFIQLMYLDLLTVFDGSNGSTVLGSYYTHFGGIFASSANFATVRFNTDASNTNLGFVLAFQAVDSYDNTCGAIKYTNASNTAGVIESHQGYSASEKALYAPNLACQWTLLRRPGFYINVFLETYYLGAGDCLRIVTKHSSGVTQPGSDSDVQYCGLTFGSGRHWVTTGDAHISFTTDSAYESIGFVIKFYYEQACPPVEQWDSDNGEIRSHTNAGTTSYVNSLTCNWQIAVSPGKRVVAWFTSMRMGSSNDRVILYSGLSGSGTLFQSFSSPLNRGYRSSSNIMRIRFTTDSTGQSTGFRMRYSAADNFCDGRVILTDPSGEFFSHNNLTSANYLSYSDCYWTIVAPVGHSVTARFSSFSLGSGSYVYIYNAATASSAISSFNDRHAWDYMKTVTIVSSSNTMLVNFRSTGIESTGFGIKYDTEQHFCQNTELLASDRGELASHRFAGNASYSIASTCYRIIRVSSPKRILVRFSFFNLTRQYEAVTLYDGAIDSTVLANLDISFSNTARYFLTTGSLLTLRCHMPYSGSASRGFRMKYEATDDFCEVYKLIRNGSGEISSHKSVGVAPYVGGLRCTWQIFGPPGVQISANLIYFNMISTSDSISLRQGADESSIVTIQGGVSTWPTKFLTLSNILTVIFTSGSTADGLGFRLQYSVGDSGVPAETSTIKTLSTTTTRHQVTSTPSVPTATKISTSKPSSSKSFETTVPSTATTTKNILQPVPQESFPTYALALVIGVPLGAIAIAAIVVAVCLHKRREGLQQEMGHPNSYTEGSAGPLSSQSISDDYLEADKVHKNPADEDYYDYIGMKPQDGPQLSTFNPS